jgi:hypothetical protein
MTHPRERPPLVVGMRRVADAAPHRRTGHGDDVGVVVARRVAAVGRDVEVLACDGSALTLQECWQDRDVVVLQPTRTGMRSGLVETLTSDDLHARHLRVGEDDIGLGQAHVLAATMGVGPASLHAVTVEVPSHGRWHHDDQRLLAEAVEEAARQVLLVLDHLDGARLAEVAAHSST